MSEKEQIKAIVDSLPEYKLSKLLIFLKGMAFDDEIEDDKFCEKLYEDYLNSPDKGDFIPFEEAMKEMGISEDELQSKD